MLHSETIKLGLTQISQRYGKESSRDSFEYIAILIKKNWTTTETIKFFRLTCQYLRRGLGGKSPSGIYGFD